MSIDKHIDSKCPFCGNYDTLLVHTHYNEYYVECITCEATGPATKHPDTAVTYWEIENFNIGETINITNKTRQYYSGGTLTPPAFKKLKEILDLAYDQAANGKGKERHNPSGQTPFEDQPIMETTRAHGLAHPTGQAEKKLRESHRLIELIGYDSAIKEVLGAIVYSCAAVLYLQEEKDKSTNNG